jgi:hypothetical protein
MAQSRPPRKFPGLTEEQSAGIFAELDRLRNDVVDVTPNPRTLGRQSGFVGARAGDVLRLYPPTSGQKLFLPLSNTVPYGSTVDVLLDATRGSLTVSTGPVKIGSTLVAGQVNGEARVILSTTGRFRFQSDGERGWFGGAAGAAGADGADGADSAMKQIRREVFYANGDLELYDADNVLVSTTTSSTWTIQSDGNQYEVWVVPSGSTGGSGSRNTTQNNGGGTGGGGPDIGHEFYARPIMAAQSPATVTVGSGVTGPTGIAAGRTAVAGTGGTAGNPSSFGSLLSAYQVAAVVAARAAGACLLVSHQTPTFPAQAEPRQRAQTSMVSATQGRACTLLERAPRSVALAGHPRAAVRAVAGKPPARLPRLWTITAETAATALREAPARELAVMGLETHAAEVATQAGTVLAQTEPLAAAAPQVRRVRPDTETAWTVPTARMAAC